MLRKYQLESLNGNAEFPGIINTLMDSGKGLLVLPTGTGKTVVFASITREYVNQKKRVLILAHRGELLNQAIDKLRQFTKFRLSQIAIEKAEQSIAGLKKVPPIVVASVQSLHKKRRVSLPRDLFDLIIVDECHRGVAATYRHIYEHFNTAHILGVTATPERRDKKDIRKIFGEPSYVYELRTAINEKYLVPINLAIVDVQGIDLSSIKLVAGDLNEGELEKVMMQEENLHNVAVPIVELSEERKTLVFCTGIEHSKAMAEMINRYKPNSARYIDGTFNESQRNVVYSAYKRNEFQYLCNCALLLEGYDEPEIACVAMARPTTSKTVYAQGVGRGTRIVGKTYEESIANGKSDLLLLDFVGNSGKHSLVSGVNLLADDDSDEAIERAISKIKSGGTANILSTLAEVTEEIAEEKRAKIIAGEVKYRVRKHSPFAPLGIDPASNGDAPAYDSQKAFIERYGLPVESINDIDKTQADEIINAIVQRTRQNLCTYKQAKLLSRYGIDTNISKQTASKIIDVIIKWEFHLSPNVRRYVNELAIADRNKYEQTISEPI